ncbi:MAG TPA: PRTRC system ThiF family protein [Duganella sp.]|nr:PRTRC system ThiF family protein [Duganella sp.]
MPHFIPPDLLNRRVEISLAGVGGNGSQMLTGLARLNHALTELGHPGLKVRSYDPDTVSESNIGRQLFSRVDVGASKAHVLTNRINAFFGSDWQSHFGRYDADSMPDILIMCVDSAKARHDIHRSLRKFKAQYLLDLGNRASDGQVVFGQVMPTHDLTKFPEGHVALASPYEILPELIDITKPEDDAPSCGLAEALERQELFINQAVVTPALNILWEFFRYGRLTWHGAFVNLRTGSMRPLMVKDAQPAEEIQITV